MKFISHYSSSKGNAYEVVADSGGRLLVECGVPWAKMEKALGFRLYGIEGCLLSHSHADHCRAAKDLTKNVINVYASHETLDAIGITDWHANILDCIEVGDETRYQIRHLDSFDVLPFGVQHDVPCLGFVIHERATDEYLLFATDFFCLEQKFPYPFSIVALACSYDTDILQRLVDNQAIDETLAKRLLFSHPSKQWLMDYLLYYVNRSKCREIYLLHCSAGNLDAEAARLEIETEFMIDTFVHWEV